MTNSTPSVGLFQRRWFRRLCQVPVLLLIVADLVLMAAAYFTNRDQRRLEAVLAELDRSDPGWRWDDIQASRRKLSDTENSANIVLKAAGLIPESWPSREFFEKSRAEGYEDLIIEPAAQLDRDRTAFLRAEMARIGPALAVARRLVDFPYGRYPMRVDRHPVTLLVPHVRQALRVSTLLRYDTLLRLQDGDTEGALHSAMALLNVARSIGDEPLFTSQSLRIAARIVLVRCIERILAEGEPTDARLATLQSALMQEEADRFIVQALRGERASFDIFWQAIANGEETPQHVRAVLTEPAPSWNTGWSWLDQSFRWWITMSLSSVAENRAAMLEFNTKVVAIAKIEPIHSQVTPLRELEKDLKALPELARLLTPAVDSQTGEYSHSQAELRCAIVAVAAERFRLANGRWPETLAELTPHFLPQVPLDPFADAPLRYRKREPRALVYSVGYDGEDNGGTIDRSKPAITNGIDLGFWLFDVSDRRQPPVPQQADGKKREEKSP